MESAWTGSHAVIESLRSLPQDVIHVGYLVGLRDGFAAGILVMIVLLVLTSRCRESQ